MLVDKVMLLESLSLSRFTDSSRSIALLDTSLSLSIDSRILLIVLVSSFTKKPHRLEFVSSSVEFKTTDIAQGSVAVDHEQEDEATQVSIDIEEQLLPLVEAVSILERKIPEAPSL